MDDLMTLAILVGTTLAVAAAGGIATVRAVRQWYPSLAKPRWTPPNGIFGPVWTILYLTMAVAAWLVDRSGADLIVPFTWFGGQLALNLLWSLTFFGLRSPAAGLVVIVLLWGAIAGTIVSFAGASITAAALLVPYLAWVTFATALNAAIVRLAMPRRRTA